MPNINISAEIDNYPSLPFQDIKKIPDRWSHCQKGNILGLDNSTFERKIVFFSFSYASVLTYVLGTQKNCLVETVLLSTHNI